MASSTISHNLQGMSHDDLYEVIFLIRIPACLQSVLLIVPLRRYAVTPYAASKYV